VLKSLSVVVPEGLAEGVVKERQKRAEKRRREREKRVQVNMLRSLDDGTNENFLCNYLRVL
jgi:hypothetical protein